MNRLAPLDGMRGYFLVFMMLNHLIFTGGLMLVKLNHGELGYVQDAQGFVFLSGLLIGLVYARQMQKNGYAPAATKIRRRAFELYRWALICIFGIIAVGFLLPQSHVFWNNWLDRLAHNDPGFMVAAASLLFQPVFMDILPQYIVYLLVAPPLVWLCITGRAWYVALGSGFLWLAVQLGLHLPLRDAIDGTLAALWPGLRLQAHFNIFAWQVVFMSGLVLGSLTAVKAIDWKAVLSPEKPQFAVAALGFLVLFAIVRLMIVYGPMPEAIVERIGSRDVRGEFSLQYLVNFAVLGYLIAWLMVAGVRSANPVAAMAGRGLHRLFTLPFLQLIGRHSLQVYVWHVFVVYMVRAIDQSVAPMSEPVKTAIALTAIASLAIPALWRERATWFGSAPAPVPAKAPAKQARSA
ncbi:OpgC family protein [Methylobrevis albus]|uniref:OpgC domain-containing protein n=1 Tax=Methylobrevis albus TaxID=2793297 RepID=A0A931I357_9HYPH|nr:OpgC domain-containing protein [Methylobrevis albus]MBH0239385.1 OpgC domain-containing protein [Methylobrevis albus]